MTVTTEYLRPGDVDEAAYEAWVAKETRRTQRLIDRGHRDFAGVTDARAFAETYCRMYRHQFRTLVPAKAAVPR